MPADNVKRNEELVLDDTVKVSKEGNPILGVLEGPCADVINPTRNDRKYDEELWERVFNDEIVNEYFENGGILGELDHPADRTETDTSKVAICMPEKPKRGKDGKLYAKFDILDTPNGRIAYTLAKYGYKLGVSSRGDGDVYEAFDGSEHVDPKTYSLKAFDLVLLPAVKAARLKLKESVGNKTLKQAIQESLKSATPSDKKIMVETLDRLNIDYKPKTRVVKKIDNCESNPSTNEKVANDVGTQPLIEELTKQIKTNKELNEQLRLVQEKLSVCYAKEAKYQEKLTEISKSEELTKRVSELESDVVRLQEQLDIKDETIKSQKARLFRMVEDRKIEREGRKSLNESIEKTNALAKEKDSEIKALKENLESLKSKSNKATEDIKTLTESLNDCKTKLSLKSKEYNEKIQKANRIVEHYKNVADKILNQYIDDKATMYCIDGDEIRNQLKEGFTFEDINRICESVKKYNLSMSKLPVGLQSGSTVKAKIKAEAEPIIPKTGIDDEVDDSLLRLAGMKD